MPIADAKLLLARSLEEAEGGISYTQRRSFIFVFWSTVILELRLDSFICLGFCVEILLIL
jgi:hypothetical protein